MCWTADAYGTCSQAITSKKLIVTAAGLNSFAMYLAARPTCTLLDLSNNYLDIMEPSIMTFVNLTHIDFSYNRLKEIPGAIGNLRELVVFRANGNLISELPSSMGFIETLESLALAENGMRSFCVHTGVCTCSRLTDVRT